MAEPVNIREPQLRWHSVAKCMCVVVHIKAFLSARFVNAKLLRRLLSTTKNVSVKNRNVILGYLTVSVLHTLIGVCAYHQSSYAHYACYHD